MQKTGIIKIPYNNKIKSANSPNFRSYKICESKSDAVEISNKDDKKNKKNKLLLGIIGTVAAVGTAVVSFMMLRKPDKAGKVLKSEFKNLKQIRECLSKIFEKDFTEKEANELAKRYKEICKIKDDGKYVRELFEQLKNDYGFKNSQIKLGIKDFTSANAPNWMAMHTDTGHMILISRVDNKFTDRASIFNALFHELKHHKQFEIAVATDKSAYEQAVALKKINEFTQEQIERNGGRDAVLEWLKEQGRKFMKPEFDRIEREIGQLPKDSPLYKRGLEYIKAKQNYIQEKDILSKNSDYKNNILEQEADIVEGLAKELFGLIS